MNWFKKAFLFDKQHYFSPEEKEYNNLYRLTSRWLRQYKMQPNPELKRKIIENQRKLHELKMYLLMENKKTDLERENRLENYQLRTLTPSTIFTRNTT